jgi:hypothetical protein
VHAWGFPLGAWNFSLPKRVHHHFWLVLAKYPLQTQHTTYPFLSFPIVLILGCTTLSTKVVHSNNFQTQKKSVVGIWFLALKKQLHTKWFIIPSSSIILLLCWICLCLFDSWISTCNVMSSVE